MVRKTYSIVDFLKDINKTFHDDDPAFHVIPESRELVAQYAEVSLNDGSTAELNVVTSVTGKSFGSSAG